MATYSVTNSYDFYSYVGGTNGKSRASIGDTIQLSAGTYILNSGELNPASGVTIMGALSGGVPTVIIQPSGTNHFHVRGSGTSPWLDNQILISGIQFDLTYGTNTGSLQTASPIGVICANVKFKDCVITGKNAANSAGIVWVNCSGFYMFGEMENCSVYNVGGDCIAAYGQRSFTQSAASYAATNQHSYLKLYDCTVHSAGQTWNGAAPAFNKQLTTGHYGVPVYIYGGTYYNGIIYSGPSPVFCYFANSNMSYVEPGTSGQTNTNSVHGFTVAYGNWFNGTDKLTYDHYNQGSNATWTTAEQVILREYGLCKRNAILPKVNFTPNGAIINSYNNGNMIVEDNYLLNSTWAASNKSFVGFLNNVYDGNPRNTGIHYVVRRNIIDTDCTVLRSTDSVPVGTGLTLDVSNNTILRSTELIGGGSVNWAVQSGNRLIVTNIWNNYIASGNLFRANTAASDVWGVVKASGNVVTASTPTNFPGSVHISTLNQFGVTGGVLGALSGIKYTIVTGGNLDYNSGVFNVNSTKYQGLVERAMGENFVGAKARQTYSSIQFPTVIYR